MIFVKSFKGYEDRLADLDAEVNGWITENHPNVLGIRTALAHEPDGRAKMGDLIYTVVYKADAPVE